METIVNIYPTTNLTLTGTSQLTADEKSLISAFTTIGICLVFLGACIFTYHMSKKSAEVKPNTVSNEQNQHSTPSKDEKAYRNILRLVSMSAAEPLETETPAAEATPL